MSCIADLMTYSNPKRALNVVLSKAEDSSEGSFTDAGGDVWLKWHARTMLSSRVVTMDVLRDGRIAMKNDICKDARIRLIDVHYHDVGYQISFRLK